MRPYYTAVCYALCAAVCYGFSAPISKLLLKEIPPAFLAALLYLGAGLTMGCVSIFRSPKNSAEKPLSRRDIPFLTAMVLLDTAAPILLLIGLQTATPAAVALLNNFEIAATALVAFIWFKEKIGKRLWAAILILTAACILLTVENFSSLSFSWGALWALAASVCWGVENNTTRVLSAKNPVQTVMVKGFGSGLVALTAAAWAGQLGGSFLYILGALLLGAFAYGCSVYFYILAQRRLGAARTGVYYAAAPFIGVFLSFVLIGQPLGASFCSAFCLMLLGTYLAVTETRRPKALR